MSYSKIILGGAQLGLNYGISNHIGKTQISEVKRISEISKRIQISSIDTASNYGDSEKVIGNYFSKDLNIITKISLENICKNQSQASDYIKNNVETSLKNLKIDKLYGLLLHNTEYLEKDSGDLIWNTIVDLKNEGIIQNIGYSIYAPEELDKFFISYKPDIVQAPLNIFDQRLKDSGWLSKLKKSNAEIHVRSIFMQGLLLMHNNERPKYFQKWNKLWNEWDKWLSNSKISPIEACIAFAFNQEEVDKIVIGISSSNDLEEILDIINNQNRLTSFPSGHTDEDLINPSNWKIS